MPRSKRDEYKRRLGMVVEHWGKGSRVALDFALEAHNQHPDIEEALAGLVDTVMTAAEIVDSIRERI